MKYFESHQEMTVMQAKFYTRICFRHSPSVYITYLLNHLSDIIGKRKNPFPRIKPLCTHTHTHTHTYIHKQTHMHKHTHAHTHTHTHTPTHTPTHTNTHTQEIKNLNHIVLQRTYTNKIISNQLNFSVTLSEPT